MVFSLADIGIELRLHCTNIFTFDSVGGSFAANDFKDFGHKSVGTELTNSFAKCPVTLLGERTLDMLEPAPTKRFGRGTVLDIGNPDILKLAYSQAVDDVVAIGAGLSLHHAYSISGKSGRATEIALKNRDNVSQG
jgi:hypothetical protein